MLKHKIINTFSWKTWEVNTVCLMKLVHFMSYSIRNYFIKKFYKNCSLETSSRPFCVCKELSTTSIGKCLKQSTYIRYVIAKLLRLVQISMLASSEFFLQILRKLKRLKLVSRPHFTQNFLKKIYFVMLHKLAKFHYQTAFTSQIIE